MLAAIERILDRVDWLLSRLAAAVVLAVMVMIVCDVAGRYLFGRPLPWVYDLVSIYVINVVLYFMVSEVLRTQSHIELDLEIRLLPPRAWSVLQAIAWLAVAAALALAAWVGFAVDAGKLGQG
jgi:TRAP-type C4-dicarboxylate transport system permease small subunit